MSTLIMLVQSYCLVDSLLRFGCQWHTYHAIFSRFSLTAKAMTYVTHTEWHRKQANWIALIAVVSSLTCKQGERVNYVLYWHLASFVCHSRQRNIWQQAHSITAITSASIRIFTLVITSFLENGLQIMYHKNSITGGILNINLAITKQ